MLTLVEVYDERNVLALSLPIQGSSGSYTVKDISGLDPVKANIVTTDYASLDGAQYQSSRTPGRNIVMKLGYNPDLSTQDVASLRLALYGFFLPKQKVKLRFFSDHMATVEISGWVESCESPIFAKDPEVAISIICPYPYFTTPSVVTVNGNSTAGTTDVGITYNGTVDTGFTLVCTAGAALASMAVRVANPLFTSTLTATYAIANADVVYFKTQPGGKNVYKIQGGTYQAYLLSYTAVSDSGYLGRWPRFRKGSNQFRVVAATTSPWTLTYYERYGGL